MQTDRYRAEREWLRYEGTPQRDLFRELRRRFLARHAHDAVWVLDAGSGPGRFTRDLGSERSRKVAFDLGFEMLRFVPPGANPAAAAEDPGPFRVRGDLARPPFSPAAFGEVAVLGNTLGFAGPGGESLLVEAERLVAPGGTLVLETAPGAGEVSRYLARLPASAVGRLLEAPPRLVVSRIAREGFAVEPRRHREQAFRRWSAKELLARYARLGWNVEEACAVAPALGPDADRTAAVAKNPSAWAHLLAVEETLGRDADRQSSAAALLLAARRPGGPAPAPA